MAKLINFDNFTVDNGAIRDLNELLFTTTFNDPKIETVLTTMKGIENGKKLGYIDSIDDVGTKSSGCKPTYSKVNIKGFEKTWQLGEWAIPKEFCYQDLTETVAKYGMHAGTERGDLQDTPYWDKFLIPLMQKATTDMFWRLAWFGDTAATNISDEATPGNITDGVDVNLLNIADGLWKRLETIIADNPEQKTEITANSKATYAEQKSAIRAEGYAIDIIDKMLSDADGRIDSMEGNAIFMTNSLFKALRSDVYARTKYQLTTEKLMDGIVLSEYDGKTVVVLDIWDRMIKKYENNGTKYNLPHRAVYTSPSNLFAGTSDTGLFADLDINFDRKERQNYIYAAGDFGTLIGEDDLVQVAI